MPDPFVSDVQFQCTDGSGCTHITAKCNGVNNCAVGTTAADMTIEAMIGYTVPWCGGSGGDGQKYIPVSYTHLRAHET